MQFIIDILGVILVVTCLPVIWIVLYTIIKELYYRGQKMKSRNKRIERLKVDLYNQWIIFRRMPLLVIYMSAILAGITITGYLVSNIIIFKLGR